MQNPKTSTKKNGRKPADEGEEVVFFFGAEDETIKSSARNDVISDIRAFDD